MIKNSPSTFYYFLGGGQCPNSSALQEVRSCNDHPCTVYHWQTGPWGQCIEDTSVPSANSSLGRAGTGVASNEAFCSVGMQTRKVICVRVNVGQVPPKKYVFMFFFLQYMRDLMICVCVL